MAVTSRASPSASCHVLSSGWIGRQVATLPQLKLSLPPPYHCQDSTTGSATALCLPRFASRFTRSQPVRSHPINISPVNERRSSLSSHSPTRQHGQAEPCFLDHPFPLPTTSTPRIICCHDVALPSSCHLSSSVSAHTCHWSSIRSRRVQMDATNSKQSSTRNSVVRKESPGDARKTGLRRTSPIHPR